MSDLNSVFEDNQTEETEAEEVAAKADETKTEATEAKEVEGEKAATPADESDDGPTVPVKALKDERQKRQAAVEENKFLKEQIAKLRGSKAQDEEETETPEPEKSEEAEASPKDATEWNLTVKFDRKRMMRDHEDYVEKEKLFIEIAKKNQFYAQKMRESEYPAEYAYKTASDYLEAQKLSDPEYLAELRKKAMPEPEEEETPEEKRKKSAVKVPDLTKASAKGKNTLEPESKAGLDDALAGAPF